MAIAQEFEYHRPKTVSEAVELKAEAGPKGKFLAGGTDLVVNLSDEVVSPDTVIDLKGIEELKNLQVKDGKLLVGALVTFTDLIKDKTVKEKFPLLWEAAGEVANVAIRNRATPAGNICSCVPCMDSAPALVVYGAAVVIRGKDGERKVSAEEFFIGPRQTVLEGDEMVIRLEIPIPEEKNGTSYLKQKRYRGEDLAQSSVAVMALPGNRYRIVFGSVGPTPIRAEAIEELLAGTELDESLIEKAAGMVKETIAPIDDVRSSKEYRILMCEVMLKRALKAAAGRLSGKGPEYGTALL